jgi:hypothetical protein
MITASKEGGEVAMLAVVVRLVQRKTALMAIALSIFCS